MAISKRKTTLVHVSLLLLVFLIGLVLLIMPFDVGGKTPSSGGHRSPLEIRNHAPNEDRRYENSQSVRRIQDEQRRLDNARRDVDRAQMDVYNAYIPSNINQNSRYYNIMRAESALDAAKSNEQMRSSDLYMQKRILESNQRDQNLKQQRNNSRYQNIRRY